MKGWNVVVSKQVQMWQEQARIEETMDGEPASELSSERLPWPGEETAENVEGAALDEALWTGRPRDFDWGD